MLSLRGRLAALDGDHEAALALMEQSLGLLRNIGDQQGIAFGSLHAAASALQCGDRADAARHLVAALTVARESDERLVLARALEGVAQLIAATAPDTAVGLAGAAAALRETLGFDRTLQEQAQLERWLAPARSRLGHAVYAKAWQQAQGDAQQHAVGVALSVAEGVADRHAE
ncbi:MAG: hypothetical protein ACR2IK_14620 [Chloroflexota bacterium]